MPFEFNPSLDSMDMVPEEYQGLYSPNEEGNAVVLDPVLAGKLDVSGLTSALDKERKEKSEIKKQVKEWTALGESPQTVQERIKELTELAQKDKEGKANWDKIRADLEKAHRQELEQKDLDGQKKDQALARYLINAEATAAISELKGSPTLLLPHVKNSVKVIEENGDYVVRVVDAQGDARGNKSGGFMSVRELVQEMKTDAQFLRAFDAENKPGTGTPPGGPKKPVTPTSPKGEDKSSIQKIADGFAQRQQGH